MATQASPQHPQSRLLALPPELRNRIWQHVVIADEAVGPKYQIELNSITRTVDYDWANGERRLSFAPPIIQVNQQIRAETGSWYYTANTFAVCRVTKKDMHTIKAWLGGVGVNAKHIKRLEIHGGNAKYSITITGGDGLPPVASVSSTFHSWCSEQTVRACQICVQFMLDSSEGGGLNASQWKQVIEPVFWLLDDTAVGA